MLVFFRLTFAKDINKCSLSPLLSQMTSTSFLRLTLFRQKPVNVWLLVAGNCRSFLPMPFSPASWWAKILVCWSGLEWSNLPMMPHDPLLDFLHLTSQWIEHHLGSETVESFEIHKSLIGQPPQSILMGLLPFLYSSRLSLIRLQCRQVTAETRVLLWPSPPMACDILRSLVANAFMTEKSIIRRPKNWVSECLLINSPSSLKGISTLLPFLGVFNNIRWYRQIHY